MSLQLKGRASVSWWFELMTAEGVRLPFDAIGAQRVDCSFEGMKYGVRMDKGRFLKPPDDGAVLRMSPQGDMINLVF